MTPLRAIVIVIVALALALLGSFLFFLLIVIVDQVEVLLSLEALLAHSVVPRTRALFLVSKVSNMKARAAVAKLHLPLLLPLTPR
jgi:hypothetical protein